MTTDPLRVPTPVRVRTFVLVTLATIGIAVATFALAAYLTEVLGLRIPVANLWLSILLCTGGLTLSGMALRGRGSWREVASFMLPGLVAAIVALRFGMPGVYLAFFLAYFLYLMLRWWRTKQPPKADET